MSESPLAQSSNRLRSLDVFRGMTIAGMVLVNNPGTWGAIYDPLEHAKWHGWTPTDFIFPFFLYIIGVAMTFSFDKRRARGDSRLRLFEQVVRRAIILFLLGMILGGYPRWRMILPYIAIIAGLGFIYADEPVLGWGESARARRNKIVGWILAGAAILWIAFDLEYFHGTGKRIPGVLQRIAVCYLFASLIVLNTGLRGRIAWTAALLLIYWAILAFIHPPEGYIIGGGAARAVRDAPEGVAFAGALNDWIDMKLIAGHLYRMRPDPEGILSTIPAIASILCGVLTGMYLHTDKSRTEQLKGMILAAVVLLAAGWAWGLVFPINKKIWTSSYVIFMAGWGLVFLAPCYYLNDIKGWTAWSKPFEILGMNAILIFWASGMMARQMGSIKIGTGEAARSLKTVIYSDYFEAALGKGELASLAFAICFVLTWLAIAYPLYRKKIFLKV